MTRIRLVVVTAAAACLAVTVAVVAQSTAGGDATGGALLVAPPSPAPPFPPAPLVVVESAPPAPRPSRRPHQAPTTRPVSLRLSTGVVVDSAGRPLAGIRILSLDLVTVLGRTDHRGTFTVPCRGGLVFASYAFGPDFWRAHATRTPESSPGVGNHAFRTREAKRACGQRLRIVLPAGGVVEGKADAEPGRQVYLSRVTGGVSGYDLADGDKRFGSFFATVRADGTYRIEGLATGRYSIESSYEGFRDEATFIDVHEGETADGSYTYYEDPAVCAEAPPDDPECAAPSPEPTS